MEAVAAIEGIGTSIARMSQVAETIAQAVDQQGSATREIATNISEAARGTEIVTQTIAGVTQTSGEVGSAASQMLGAAGELAQQSERLSQEIGAFLVRVRAA
jgi:methyl-accepting chemotaxis protein